MLDMQYIYRGTHTDDSIKIKLCIYLSEMYFPQIVMFIQILFLERFNLILVFVIIVSV